MNSFLTNLKQQILNTICCTKNPNPNELIKTIQPVQITAKSYEMSLKDIPGSEFPKNSNVQPDQKYTRSIATISVSFSGDLRLFNDYKFDNATITADNSIRFYITFWGTNKDDVDATNQITNTINIIKSTIDNINKDVKEFNDSLPKDVQTKLTEIQKYKSIIENAIK